MKRKILIVVTFLIVSLSSVAFASQEVIEVKLNDKYIDFTDNEGNRVDPTLINSRTMVPMRKIFETFGAEVEWDGATQKVTAKTNNKEISLQINNKNAMLKDIESDETKTITLDSEPVILDGRTMVPVRFIAESLDKQVGWDSENRVVVIIDYDEVISDLQNSCSTFIEMMNEETVEIKTFDIATTIKGDLNYKDSQNSKKNESLTISGEASIKKSDDRFEISFDLSIKGKGMLKEALEENGYNKIKFGEIIDLTTGDVYSCSSFENDGKWVKSEDSGSGILFTGMLSNINVNDLIILNEEELDKDSYEKIKNIAKIITKFVGNDRVKSSGKTTKTYTMKWGLDDIISELKPENEDELKEILSLGKAAVELTNTYKNGVMTKSKINIDISLQMKDTKEKLTGNITIETKYKSYNKNVSISLPKVK